MSFAFCFDRADDVYHFSYSYPYTYSRLQAYLDKIERKKLPYVKRELLTLTVVSLLLFKGQLTILEHIMNNLKTDVQIVYCM